MSTDRPTSPVFPIADPRPVHVYELDVDGNVAGTTVHALASLRRACAALIDEVTAPFRTLLAPPRPPGLVGYFTGGFVPGPRAAIIGPADVPPLVVPTSMLVALDAYRPDGAVRVELDDFPPLDPRARARDRRAAELERVGRIADELRGGGR